MYDDDDKILICLPNEPEHVSNTVIPKTIAYFAQSPYFMEASTYKILEENSKLIYNIVEFIKPPNWDDDEIKIFVTCVANYAMKQAQEIL